MMKQTFIDTQWAALCSSAQSTASRLSEEATAEAGQLMHREAAKLCDLAPPVDKPSLEEMYTRRMALSTRLTAIARADAMVRIHPDSAAEIYSQVERFCDGDFPSTSDAFLEMQVRNIELTSAVATLCEADMAAQR